MDDYVSTQDLADRLGVSVFTIRRYIRAGKLPAVKLDGVYRVSRDDIAEFLRSREISGPHAPADSSPTSKKARTDAELVSVSTQLGTNTRSDRTADTSEEQAP
jgi:excisionase family DNA binding protein